MGMKRKVTDEMVCKMNQMVKAGIPKVEVARQMGISIGSVKTYVYAKPPEKVSVNDVWAICWMKEWDKVRKNLLELKKNICAEN